MGDTDRSQERCGARNQARPANSWVHAEVIPQWRNQQAICRLLPSLVAPHLPLTFSRSPGSSRVAM